MYKMIFYPTISMGLHSSMSASTHPKESPAQICYTDKVISSGLQGSILHANLVLGDGESHQVAVKVWNEESPVQNSLLERTILTKLHGTMGIARIRLFPGWEQYSDRLFLDWASEGDAFTLVERFQLFQMAAYLGINLEADVEQAVEDAQRVLEEELRDGNITLGVCNKKVADLEDFIQAYSKLKSDGRVSPPKLTHVHIHQLFEQLLTAIANINKLGYAHRDIKPENILIYSLTEKNIEVGITDFGLVVPLNVRTGIAGTLNYMPSFLKPRIWHTYDGSEDLYGIGLTIEILLRFLDPEKFEKEIKLAQIIKKSKIKDIPELMEEVKNLKRLSECRVC